VIANVAAVTILIKKAKLLVYLTIPFPPRRLSFGHETGFTRTVSSITGGRAPSHPSRRPACRAAGEARVASNKVALRTLEA
jgi:hypothetical protein